MNITFKVADKNDVQTIITLANDIWRKHYLTIISIEQINYMLAKMYTTQNILSQFNQGHVFTIVSIDNIPNGYISISKKSDGEYYLHKFYVNVDNHRKGVGSNLFDYVIEKFTQKNSIELTVNRQNYKAINFYFKKGFKIIDVADFDIGNGFVMNDFVMKKER